MPQVPIGLNEIQDNVNGSLLAYPNPFKEKLTIEFNANQNDQSNIEVFALCDKREIALGLPGLTYLRIKVEEPVKLTT
jgi:hypothetical protein